MSDRSTVNGAGRYEIRLKGHLDSRWVAWFDGLTLTGRDVVSQSGTGRRFGVFGGQRSRERERRLRSSALRTAARRLFTPSLA